ncbi:hypothetical protein [Zobellia alginiliquefaciens]|uniref:hypothetical protein n=1 Tax=Zobellia alginiliquefaciens TaxID=3032586 RepID=UPI0023E21FE8|nr:hypothetical protein [Zobellia alginiliquefaciens]
MLQYLFIATTLLSLILFYQATGKDKRVLVFSILWLLLIGVIAYNGYFENTEIKPPRFIFAIIPSFFVFAWIYKSIAINSLIPKFLVAVHMVRIPVELILYQLFLQKKVPILMTFKGWNFDIIMGISAAIILIYMTFTKKTLSRLFLLTWNVLGLVLLTTIVLIAILSSPLPIQLLAFDQPNLAVLQFPYIYLPTYIVPIVYVTHILAIQKS